MGSSKKHKREREPSRRHKHKSRSRTRSRSPISPEQRLDRDRDRRHHKKHKERRLRGHRSPEKVREEYHSDSSDVVEVPLAPPAPTISKQARSPSPIPEGGAGDCLSIEETNKLRAKLGLKPLEVNSEPAKRDTQSDDKDDNEEPKYKDEYGEFYHKPAGNIFEIKQVEKIRDKIKERREKRKLEDKLARVKGLGESDEDDDLSKWVSKTREKERLRQEAAQRAKMLEEMDAEFGVDKIMEQKMRDKKRDAYKDRDLKGLRVEHDIEEFSEGKTIILTLKDQDVLEDAGDTLINVNMIDNERYKKNVENKKLNPMQYGYDCYADETVDEFGQPISRPILKKYDEEIDGTKKSTFVIGRNLQEEREQRRKLLEIKSKLEHKRLETLDEPTLIPASEYYSEAELAKFKKPKKKIKKIRKTLKADDLLEIVGEADTSSDLRRRPRRHSNEMGTTEKEIDNDFKAEPEDDDLEKVLSKARRLKQKENLIVKSVPVEQIDIKSEIKSESNSDDESLIAGREGHIVLNATAEFCRTLGDIPTYGMAGNRDEDTNEMMDFETFHEEQDELMDEPEKSTGTWNSVNPDVVEIDETTSNTSHEIADVAILDEEPDVSSGVAGALRLAMSKGYLEKEEKNRPSNTRMAHLQAKNYSIEDKTYVEDDKFGRRDRYHSGPAVDFKEKDTFKPNVKLEYIDDGGRILNAKEAFRYLSHKFHGKGPGKNKIEKRLKKNEQEGLMMKMSSTDTPLGTLNMLQAKQKETQSPYIVLSGSKQTHAGTSIVKHKMK